jgi:glutamine synthetase
MCDVCTPEGQAVAGCGRSNLKRVLERVSAEGFDLVNVAFEPEFFVFKHKPYSTVREDDLVDSSGYCSGESRDETAKLRREIVAHLENMGISVCADHHERSPSQHEITYKYDNAVSACDTILLVKEVVKEIAVRHGLFATFMPKPLNNENGSGLHTNISFSKDGRNVFEDRNGAYISDIGRRFISGVLAHAQGLSLLTNPTINSYKRLGVDGCEAPVNICWGEANRSSMVRIPRTKGPASRVEIRSTDASANPYFAVSGIVSAGLDGIVKKLPFVESINTNVYSLSRAEREKLQIKSLPSSLSDAVTEFERDSVITACVAPEAVKLFIANAKNQILAYTRTVNSFDFDNYF